MCRTLLFSPAHVLQGSDRQSSILSQSSSTKSERDGIVNSSTVGSDTEEFLVLATNSSTKEKVQDLQPLKWRPLYKKPCNSLTFLAKTKAKMKHVYQVHCLSKDNLRGLYDRRVKLLKTNARF